MRTVRYTPEFKRLVLQRILSEEGGSTRKVAEEAGIAKSTVWDWQQEVNRACEIMGIERKGHTRSASRWSAAEKLRVVMQSQAMNQEELGAYLRKEGVPETLLITWREQILQALQEGKRPSESVRVRELERKLKRKEKRLRQVEALVELKKKVEKLWEDEAESTESTSDSTSSSSST